MGVDRQLVPAAPPTLAPPKTKRSYRTVPLPQVVADALAAHLASSPAGRESFVFTNEAGSAIRRTAFSDIWRLAIKNAGEPTGTDYHAFRHYFASLAIRHGGSVETVQARLGHHDATETLNTYGHLWSDSEGRTRAAIDDVLGSTADTSRQLRGHGPPAGPTKFPTLERRAIDETL